MVRSMDIINVLCIALVKALPELKKTYIDLAPKDFERPSALIQAVKWEMTDENAFMVQVNATFTIMLVDTTDDYSNSSTKSLLQLRDRAMELFLPGFLRIGDRALHVTASGGERDFDAAYINVAFSFFDSRPQKSAPPLMEAIDTNLLAKG